MTTAARTRENLRELDCQPKVMALRRRTAAEDRERGDASVSGTGDGAEVMTEAHATICGNRGELARVLPVHRRAAEVSDAQLGLGRTIEVFLS
jgi:hypothetical protein